MAPELAVVAGVAGKTGIDVSIFFKFLMDNSSNMAVNTTPTANQINPEHHYGLDKNKACLNNSCPSNTANIGCYIPAIDEIMRHNQGAPSVAHPNMTEKVQKSNDNPSLEQAEIAYEEGGSTSEEQPENINKYSYGK